MLLRVIRAIRVIRIIRVIGVIRIIRVIGAIRIIWQYDYSVTGFFLGYTGY